MGARLDSVGMALGYLESMDPNKRVEALLFIAGSLPKEQEEFREEVLKQAFTTAAHSAVEVEAKASVITCADKLFSENLSAFGANEESKRVRASIFLMAKGNGWTRGDVVSASTSAGWNSSWVMSAADDAGWGKHSIFKACKQAGWEDRVFVRTAFHSKWSEQEILDVYMRDKKTLADFIYFLQSVRSAGWSPELVLETLSDYGSPDGFIFSSMLHAGYRKESIFEGAVALGWDDGRIFSACKEGFSVPVRGKETALSKGFVSVEDFNAALDAGWSKERIFNAAKAVGVDDAQLPLIWDECVSRRAKNVNPELINRVNNAFGINNSVENKKVKMK